jgi:cobalt-zinc-cadmium efflux system membrane fusion protein
MKYIYIPLSLLFILIFFIYGCDGEQSESSEQSEDQFLQISLEQFRNEGMKIGKPEMHIFSKTIQTNGMITPSPKGEADIYSYVGGIVKSIEVQQGNIIHKGQGLCTIESKDFIKLQQKYLEYLAQLKATNADYHRIKTLYDEKVASQKEFLAIESEYNMLNAQIKAIKAELNILKVDIPTLEQGKLSAFYQITAPIRGHITEQKCNLGQFVDDQKFLMKIIDNSTLQLHFFIYPELLKYLKLGQSLQFYQTDNNSIRHTAKIISIGKSVDSETKSIKCIAEIESTDHTDIISGMYVQVELTTESKELLALPSEAILKSEQQYFVLVKETQDENNMFFRKEEVQIGMISGDFTQILGDKTWNNVLIKGAYYYSVE